MINKFPKTASKKWNRFDKLEKWFIVYCLILIISIFSFPIITINPASWPETQFYIFSTYTITTFLVILFLLIFLLLWNSSFRFKKLIHILVGFKENDAILNFGILLIMIVTYISISDTVSLLRENVSYSIWLGIWYYITGIIIIIWLIWNLFLALNLSKSNKKNKIINIIQKNNNNADHTNDSIKSLFEK